MSDVMIVTRHAGAIAFIKACGFDGIVVEHFIPEMVCKGKIVVGVLPVHLIADVLANGARFIQVIMPDIPPAMRGVELGADQMKHFGAKLVEIESITMKVV